MAKQNIGQKAERALKLLLGIRHPRIAGALMAHGFREKDLQEGWQRLAALTRIRLDSQPPVKDPRIIEAIDEFENTWFPIARATLERRYPEVASALFLNLSQSSGADVAVTVRTFLERLEQMKNGEKIFAKDGPGARTVLDERGLTAEIEKEAQAMVDVLASFEAEPRIDPSLEASQAAEEALWSWYLEWAGIARVAIRDKRLLRSLGFRQGRKGSGDVVIDVPGAPPPVAQVPANPNGLPPASAVPALPPRSAASRA